MRRLKKTVLSTSTAQAQLTLRDTEGQTPRKGVSERKWVRQSVAAEFDHEEKECCGGVRSRIFPKGFGSCKLKPGQGTERERER